MITLAARLYELKCGVGGNREKQRFEWSFGMPQEQIYHVTMPGAAIRRILGQLGFVVNLNKVQNHEYDREIGQALTVLEKSLSTHGVLVHDACAEAEQQLLPLKDAARQYTILCAAHAHIDMNWMWSWQETVAATLATFRTMLKMMDEYPDFHFSQSQTSVYRIVEEYDPDIMEDIKQRIREGRWEVSATNWVETDKNMPCTESLLRHIRLTKTYLESVWGVDPASLNIDFSPDTFGHSVNIPEIDNYGGVYYLYHCRGLTERRVLYRWQAPSGAELLAHCEPYWYNSGISADIALGIPELAVLVGGLSTSLTVYGVGNHGGGPTRRDIERIIEMQDWPVFPQVRFGTFAEYFRAAETVRDKLPVITGEINFFATGCYTTQSRIKLGNRHSEAALVDAEGLDAMSMLLTGKRYPARKFETAWQDVLFTHFHDIITGSCVRDSREYAMSRYSQALAVSGTAHEKAALTIATAIDTSMIQADHDVGTQSESAGVGYGLAHFSGTPNPEHGKGKTRVYHVFNPSAHPRRETLEFTVWDWPYDLRRAELQDHAGNALPFQLLDSELQRYWDHQYIRCLAQVEVPAFGYTTVVFREAEQGNTYPYYTNPFPRSDVAHGPITLENAFLKAEFDPETGDLRSLIDNISGEEKLPHGKTAGLVLSYAEKATNNAWQTGRYLGREYLTPTRIHPFTNNALRNGLEVEGTVLNSLIKIQITLDADAHALAYCFNITWNEAAHTHKNVPVLRFCLPLTREPEVYQSDVPAGVLNRHSAYQDIPALQYTAALFGNSGLSNESDAATALALITDCTYGYRGCEAELSATLINTASSPDPFPERGEHSIRLWIALPPSNPKSLIETASDLCHSLSIVAGQPDQHGVLAPTRALLKLDATSVILSSVSLSADDTLLLRLYEVAGKRDAVSVTLPFPVSSAEFVSLDEQVSAGAITMHGTAIHFEMPPHMIRTVKLRF
jgi:alpha-mannosidase